MAEIVVKKREEIEEQYKWDLTKMYADDQAWEEALKKVDEKIEKISAFTGTLKESPENLRAWLDFNISLERELSQLVNYAMLRRSEDSREEAAQSMFGRIYSKIVQADTLASFAEPEILSMPAEQLAAFVDAEELSPYRYTMEKMLRRQAHTLSAAEEKIMAAAGEVLASAEEVADMLRDADLTFDSVQDSEGKEVAVTSAGYIPLQGSKDRELRKNSFCSYYAGYKKHINTFAAAYATQVKIDRFQANTRHYENCRAMYMAHENIPSSVYDGLIEAVHKHLPTMHRYAKLRKEILGIEELHYYDLYAPLAQEVDITYSYEEAKNMVLKAVAPLGESYKEIVEKAFRDRWIDVYPNEGKRGGAFSGGTYDSVPYIMLNYTGTVDSVSTLAHEMGHSVHSYLSRTTQPPQYAQYTIFVAEVASTINENLMIEQLLQQDISLEMRLYLLNQYLENFKGTLFRQTMFAEFEKIAHDKAEAGEALSAQALSQIYEDLVKAYFGDTLIIDEEVRYEWARIPHFYSPFYVYKYSTSYCASMALSEAIMKEGEKAVKPYLEFLAMGGSVDPLESLSHAGVDLTSTEPIERALKKFAAVLDETERVYHALNQK